VVLLEDQVCVVSGVGPGLGREIALATSREGARVVLAARTASFLEEVAHEIESSGGRALVVPTDITDPGACSALVSQVVADLGRVDALVNSAFRPDVFQTFEDVELSAWRSIMDVNLWGSLNMTKAVVPRMKNQGGGAIVFVNSMVVRKPLPLQGGYAVSKGALMTAAQVLARELGGYGIRVNSVVPGWMWGPPVQMYVEMVAAQRQVPASQVVEELAGEMALGYIPADEETAHAVVFLASDRAKAITGQSLDVNAGEVFH
jgi:NAD(P)-dependent dehydrogenase (short-subunit alcohol dehydrogenase family)